jgi:ATP-dependent RNA helicase DDX46/PRP5
MSAIEKAKEQVRLIMEKQRLQAEKDAATASAKSNASAASRAAAIAASIKRQRELSSGAAGAGNGGIVSDMKDASGNEVEYCSLELEINDYPQQARWRVTNKQSILDLLEECDVAVTTKGSFIPPGRKPQEGEKKLCLLIEGKGREMVHRARTEILRRLEETAAEAGSRVGPSDQYGKYSI